MCQVYSPFFGLIEDPSGLALNYRPNTVYKAVLSYESDEDGLKLVKLLSELKQTHIDVLFDVFPWHKSTKIRPAVATAPVNRLDMRFNTDQTYNGIVYSIRGDEATVYAKSVGIVPMRMWKNYDFKVRLGKAVRFSLDASRLTTRVFVDADNQPPTRRFPLSKSQPNFADVAVDADIPADIEIMREARFDVNYTSLITTVKYLRTDLENYLEDKCTLADIAGRRIRIYISGGKDGDWDLSPRKAGIEWETDNPTIG
ncbi:hypothetical protein WR25_11866 [Diploscapter pachys]|uniref:Uncharacterized protein n=1 Tax=Diploscapter pachys TaxID=2018661 RepID=A0A2A2LNR0_9BILA|nr:hypothetical protein WR25_11866 [Diploscapter pachys]